MTCPTCKQSNPHTYVSAFTVECVNGKCRHFSDAAYKRAEAEAKKAAERIWFEVLPGALSGTKTTTIGPRGYGYTVIQAPTKPTLPVVGSKIRFETWDYNTPGTTWVPDPRFPTTKTYRVMWVDVAQNKIGYERDDGKVGYLGLDLWTNDSAISPSTTFRHNGKPLAWRLVPVP